MTRTHDINGVPTEITWERGELIENHGSGCCYYALDGMDSNGNEYIATGNYQDGELEDILDIETA